MNIEDIKALLLNEGWKIKEEKRLGNDTGWQVRLRSGAIVNVFDKGSLSFQGKNTDDIKDLLERSESTPNNDCGRKVFVVYGHDSQALTELESMLRRWHLEPLILGQLPSGGQTIIEKLEHYQRDVSFGVVLATPDDEGHPKGKPCEKAYRARQNVVLEMGMLLASPSLGRSRVAVLLQNQCAMERPSDIQGLIYIPFRDRVQEAATPLAQEMTGQGISIALGDL